MSDKTPLQSHVMRDTYIKLIPLFLAAIFGAVLSDMNGNVRSGDFGDKFLALIGVVLFVLASIAFLQTLTHALTQILGAHPARRLNKGRAGVLKLIMRVFGYLIVGLVTLQLVGVSVGNLLIGGAALGVILGVAAQQALANFFASIVLIVTHPYSVGDELTFNSGALGGEYTGTIKDIGLIHTRIKLAENDSLVLLPNAQLLAGTSIRFAPKSSK